MNLSDNQAGDLTGVSLSKIDNESKIETLELFYNKFNATNITLFIIHLKNLPNLKTLDLSWNNLGSSKEFIKCLGKMIESNSSLIHLDISTNNLKYIDCQSLNKYLQNNHTLMGLHL